MPLSDAVKDRIVRSTTGLFAHAPYPLDATGEFNGDGGLFGPDSVTWPVVGDSAAFLGGIRALLVQAAHPEVAAGVFDHSRYHEDPLGRLSRTSAYVTATTFGAQPEVERAVAIVRRAHRPISGHSHRGVAYTASDGDLAAWVHNALVDSFLQAYQRFGERDLAPGEADRFVAEHAPLGELMGVEPILYTAGDLAEWIDQHPALGPSPGMDEAIEFLRSPPLSRAVRSGYRVLFEAAVTTLSPRVREILGVRVRPGAGVAGSALIRGLRWALGSSPSWLLALTRVGAEIPEGRFRQPMPGGAARGGAG